MRKTLQGSILHAHTVNSITIFPAHIYGFASIFHMNQYFTSIILHKYLPSFEKFSNIFHTVVFFILREKLLQKVIFSVN